MTAAQSLGTPRITAMMTVFNRAEYTLACLRSLLSQDGAGESFQMAVVLVDDGSTDDTASIVRSEFGERVRLVEHEGGLFWSAGMALANKHAVADRPDYLLWINDDVQLFNDSVKRLVEQAAAVDEPTVVVGAMRSRLSESVTYSGFLRLSARPGHLKVVAPGDTPKSVDTVNGNLVLVPKRIYEAVGTVDGGFSHAYGDLDYGLRVKQAGFEIVLAAGYMGVCDRNPVAGSWEDRSLARSARVRALFGRKGLPLASHIRFVRRHARASWPVYVAVTYGVRLVRILVRR